MPINYDLMKKVHPGQKAALTRATHIEDVRLRYLKVREACQKAVRSWETIGAWPDDWSRWQRALDDAAFAVNRVGGNIAPQRLEEFE